MATQVSPERQVLAGDTVAGPLTGDTFLWDNTGDEAAHPNVHIREQI